MAMQDPFFNKPNISKLPARKKTFKERWLAVWDDYVVAMWTWFGWLGDGEKMLFISSVCGSVMSGSSVYLLVALHMNPVLGVFGALACETLYIGAARAGLARTGRSAAGMFALLGAGAAAAIAFGVMYAMYTGHMWHIAPAVIFPLITIASTWAAHSSISDRLQSAALSASKALERTEALQRERDAIQLETERRTAEMHSWAEGVRLKQELGIPLGGSGSGEKKPCPHCSTLLSHGQYAAASRHGHCFSCKVKTS